MYKSADCTDRSVKLGRLSLLLAVAGSLALGAAPAQAAVCTFTDPNLPAAQWDIIPPSCFEGGDGNLSVENLRGSNRIDWSTITKTTATDASGASDIAFGAGAEGKEFNPGGWKLVQGAVTPAKIDLLASATKIDPVSGDLFLYGAFLRSGDSGDANLSFELNSNPALWDNDGDASTPSIPTRTAGDVLITFDGGADARVGLCRWVGPREGTSVDPDAGWYTTTGTPVRIGGNTDCTSLTELNPPLALGSTNPTEPLDNLDEGPTTATTDDFNYLPGFPDEIPKNTFGEIAVNLTDALTTLGEPDPCFNLGSIWLHSRNSTSSSADMGDYFTPVPLVGATTCAIAVDKQVKVGSGAFEQGLTATPANASTGDVLTYKFVVTNAGQAPITNVAVSDPKCTSPISAFDKGTDTSTGTLDVGDTWTATCTRTYAAGDANTFVNTVTAIGEVGTKDLSDEDSATVRRLARLTLVKNQIGGSNAESFTFAVPTSLDADGTTALSEADGPRLYAGLTSGSYVVTEAEKANWTLTDLDCVTTGTSTPDPGTAVDTATRTATVALVSGDDVTCTFENTKRTTITVVKQVVNDNGGTATPAAWDLHLRSGGTDVTGSPKPGTAAGDTYTVAPGSFTVDETGGPSGYAATFSGDCDLSGAITATVGQDLTCTITNNDIAPKVVVKKVVVKDNGGTAVSADWNLHLRSGLTDVAGSPKFGKVDGDLYTVSAGDYTVAETGGPSGYAATFSGDCSASGAITAVIGQTKSCTITNNDIAPELTVIKNVVQSIGTADATASEFLMDISGTAGTESFPGSESGTTKTLRAGTYAVGESGARTALYTRSDSADCAGTLAPGDEKTCTITNTRKTGTLQVVKDFVGTPGSVDLKIDGVTEKAAAGDGDATSAVPVNTGNHTVSETLLANYTSAISCTDGTAVVASGSGTSLADVPVAEGKNVVCTITNTRNQGTLKVEKRTLPTLDTGRFDLKVGSTVVKADAKHGDSGELTVNTGTHTVSEVAGSVGSLDDYDTRIACDDTPQTSGSGRSLDVVVKDGVTTTCTITNVRKATVVVKKVTDPVGAADAFGFTSTLPGKATFSLRDGETSTTSVSPGSFTVTENDPRPQGYKLVGLDCAETTPNSTVSAGAAVSSERKASIVADPGETVTCTYTNRKVLAQAVVVKVGDVFAYHGDTVTYSFTVTNAGNSPLANVVVSDDKCPNVTGPTKSGGNQDALLETGESWVYTCSYVIAAHVDGEADPIVNTATVDAVDEFDRPVGDTDTHSTDLLHQAVVLDKTGPTSATAGDAVPYVITIRNTGDTSFPTAGVIISDPLCEAPPALSSRNGDATPATLDPGETWTFTCSVVTQPGQTSVDNVATSASRDINGRLAPATDDAQTTLIAPPAPPPPPPPAPVTAQSPAPQIAVLGARVQSGTAKLRGSTGCLAKSGKAWVVGTKIRSVTFFIDGKKVKTVTKAGSKGRWAMSFNPKRYRVGSHKVSARVTFSTASATQSRTLKMNVVRCKQKVLAAFTG